MNGPELKALRHRLGLSRAQAAQQVKVSERDLAQWESDVKHIPAPVMELFRAANDLAVASPSESGASAPLQSPHPPS